ncbi:hypothetical protein [Longitalea luteola]|uniref:hypothetical protein n=1 Tax=Longitalea luteola TaxID=2812563 RepID=UPI001A95AC59|nr:hypothetical protein [Longitalea luteola]
MTSVSIAVKIWAKTLMMSATLLSIGFTFAEEFFAVFICMIVLIGGFIVTLPLLMLITPLVKASVWLPYEVPAKIAWLTFWLALLILLLYVWISMLLHGAAFEEDSLLNLILAATLAGLLFAVITTRKSLKKLYSETLPS